MSESIPNLIRQFGGLDIVGENKIKYYVIKKISLLYNFLDVFCRV
jgi:hypothetical protein